MSDTQASAPALRSGEGRASGLRLLALDGGGIRGLSELCILDHIMTSLHQELGLPSAVPLRPCEVFDMIAGTSTGGLIAIMLGRLRMTVRQCIEAYSKFAETVFSDPVSKWSLHDGRFKSSRLEQAIRTIVQEQNQGETMLDTRPDACKVFVCAVAAASVNHARRLPTYDERTIGKCTIVEAARATSAAPTFFEPVEIMLNGAKERFVDGALGFNNPVLELYSEAKSCFPGRSINCLVSIGTGSTVRGTLRKPKLWETKIPKHVIEILKHVAVNCERNHELMSQQFESQPQVYFRLNVETGLEGIRLDEWRKLPDVQSITIDYLHSLEVRTRIAGLNNVLKISLKHDPPLHNVFGTEYAEEHVDGRVNQPQRQPANDLPYFSSSAILSNIGLPFDAEAPAHHISVTDRSTGLPPDQRPKSPTPLISGTIPGQPKGVQRSSEPDHDLQSQTNAFLAKLNVDMHTLYTVKDAKPIRHHGTCEWIHKKEQFTTWLGGKGSPVLLLVAPPGQGKSVLAKYILEQLEDGLAQPDCIVVDYFCKDSPGHNTATAIVKALLYQFLDDCPESLKAVVGRHKKLFDRRSEFTFDDMWKLFATGVESRPAGSCFVVIDGLDECEETSQEQLWKAIEASFLVSGGARTSSRSNIRILLTSRPTAVARRIGQRSDHLEIERSNLDPDISSYISHRIDYLADIELLPMQAAASTKSFLHTGADGMFLWASLILNQLEHWDSGITALSLPQILSEIPPDVSGLYERALQRIQGHPVRLELARSIFEILLFAGEDMSIQALGIAVAGWPDSCATHSQLNGHLDFRFHDTVKKVCGSLIQITDGRVQLCHHSAGQYLWREASKFGLFFDPQRGHARLAQICLRYLLLEDIEIPIWGIPVDESRCPLLGYALTFWGLHIRHSGEAIHDYRDLLETFFGASSLTRLEACLQRMPSSLDAFRPTKAAGPEIVVHALAFHELLNVLKAAHFLNQEETSPSQRADAILQVEASINAPDSTGYTSLMHAAEKGSLECTKVLLELGADVNARDDEGYTALHLASMFGRSAIVELLLPQVVEIDCATKERGWTPLLMADSPHIINLLLDAGADIEAKDKFGSTRLIRSSSVHSQEEIVKVLLQRGATADTTNDWNTTPLSAAARAGATAILKILIEYNAPLNHLVNGYNPLHLAVESGSAGCVELLIQAGLDPNSSTSSGYGTLEIAVVNGHTQIIHILLQSGTEIRKSPLWWDRPLFSAGNPGCVDAIVALLDAGAPASGLWLSGEGPLHYAAWSGHDVDMCRLLQRGIQPDTRSTRRQTPLQIATFVRHLKCMDALLAAGADPSLVDIFGNSAFEYATNHPACSAKIEPWSGNYKRLDPSQRAAIQYRCLRSNLLDLLSHVKGPLTQDSVQRVLARPCIDQILRCLLFLAEYDLARVLILVANRQRDWLNLECDQCYKVELCYTDEDFGVCKTCAWDICSKCLGRYSDPRDLDDRLCQGHEMLWVTESAWEELEPSNETSSAKEPIVLQRWLTDMQQRFDVDGLQVQEEESVEARSGGWRQTHAE